MLTGAPRPHYEVELQAAGAAVDGEKRCAIFDARITPEGIWSCSFPNTGTQVLHLLLKAVRPARTEGDAADRQVLLVYEHNVQVDGRFSGTDSAISLIGSSVTVASVLASVLSFVAQR